MGIRHLDKFISERKLVREAPLSALKDTRLGIDMQTYLKKLLTSPSTREPLVAALGGQPLALIHHIEEDLRVLDKARIKPVFVFMGIPPAKKQRPFTYDDGRISLRERAWKAYEAGQNEQATQLLSSISNVFQPDLFRAILRCFRHRTVEFIVAPYVSWGQLVSLERHSKSYVHSMYAANELFLFEGMDRVILDINFNTAKPTIFFASKREILADLHVSDDQFLDLSLLAGFEFCQTFPPISDNFAFKACVDLVRQYKNGFAVVMAHSEHPGVKASGYVDQFCRNRCMIKFNLVLPAEEGRVLPLPLATPLPHSTPSSATSTPAGGAGAASFSQPGRPAPALTAADVPSDLHEIFSHRFPDEVFLHLCRGLVGYQVLNTLATGYVIENAPLCNGETEDYRRFVKEYLTESPSSPRCLALALASSALNGFWTQKRVAAVYYFEPNAERTIPYASQATLQLVDSINKWNVPVPVVEDELRTQNSSTIDIALCLGATKTEQLAARTKTPKRADRQLEKKDEVVANVIWRMLELRGFLSHSHLHTPYARALHLGLKASRLNDKLQEPLFTAIELLRAGVLHANWYGNTMWSGGPYMGTDDEKSSMVLVMRTMSLLPMSFKPQPWNGPLSRELLIFNSFVKSLNRSLRSLVEMTAMSMLLRGDARRNRDDYLDIALSLPFTADTNTGLGVVIKCYFEGLRTFVGDWVKPEDADGQEVKVAKDTVLDLLGNSTFTNVKDVRAEVKRGFRFWDSMLIVVRTLKDENALSPDVARRFETANEWLKPMKVV